MRAFIAVCIICLMVMPVAAAQIEAPEVPASGARIMPEAKSFGEGLMKILRDIIPVIRPDLYEASMVCVGLIGAVMISSLIQGASEQIRLVTDIAATAGIGASMLLSMDSLISLAAQTVTEMTEYGKLLLPVMTTALAAQGAPGTSAALYTGAAVANALIGSVISSVLVPAVYIFLAVSIATAATGEEMLKKFRDLIRTAVTWCLKSSLTLFTTYMGMSGIISGSADAAALKAAKVTISSMVPVVGGILSDASETVLLSIGIARNAAGLYGIFAILAVFLEPFILIGCHYLMLKITAAVCSVFGTKRMTDFISDLSSGMGLLLGMTGAVCFLLLISCVCFIRGVS